LQSGRDSDCVVGGLPIPNDEDAQSVVLFLKAVLDKLVEGMLHFVAAAVRCNLVGNPVRQIAEVNGGVVRLDLIHLDQMKIEGGVEEAAEKVLRHDVIVEEFQPSPLLAGCHAADFFSYALLFWLPDDAQIDAKTMERELLAYYRGRAAAVLKGKKQKVEAKAFTLTITGPKQQPDKRPGGEPVAGYVGELKWIEPFATGNPQTLRLEIHTWPCAKDKHHCVFVCASPQPQTAAVWKTLREIRAGCTCR
jgi:hypothetical protein